MSSDLGEFYGDYGLIEEAFQHRLDESLHPRGPDCLYDIVAGLGLPAGVHIIDIGCGSGRQSLELARRFGFNVLGVDPVLVQIESANAAADNAPELRSLLRFELGAAEAIPAPDASVDLVWSREMLYHVPSLDKTFAECRRVLKPGGLMLLQHMFVTDLMEPREAAALWQVTDVTRSENMQVDKVEAAITTAGLSIEQCIILGGEWGEYGAENSGEPGRRLVHIARLLRDPDRYIAEFGRAAYEIMLGDCHWHVYRMIGKLSGRGYVLRAAS